MLLDEAPRPMPAPTSLHSALQFAENMPEEALPLVCTCAILGFALAAYWWCSLPNSRFGGTKASLLAESSGTRATSAAPSHGIPGGAPPGVTGGWRQADPAAAWGKPVLLAIATFGTVAFAWEMVGQRHNGRDRLEAHTMLSGVPECSRDGPVCAGAPLTSSSARTMNYTGPICCRDVMLRMLVEVGDWLDKKNVEWYVGFNTLRDGVQFNALSPGTESLDIIVPKLADQEKLRSQQDIPYRFGYYGDEMLRGAANYAGVDAKLPHHVSSPGARMWINDRVPFVPMVSCEGADCLNHKLPSGSSVAKKSSALPDSMYSGQTAFYVMDVYSGTADPDLKACGAFGADGQAVRSTEKVMIGGREFPTHQNWENCLAVFYGPNWKSSHAPAHVEAASSMLEISGEQHGSRGRATAQRFLSSGADADAK